MSTNGAPGWLGDELLDEWIEQPVDEGPEVPLPNASGGRLDHYDYGGGSMRVASGSSAGTFVVREEMPVQPILRTPGQPAAKNGMKDFFSPLPLQSMFNPPTPPNVPPSNDPQAQSEPAREPEPEPGPADDHDPLAEPDTDIELEGDLTVSDCSDMYDHQGVPDAQYADSYSDEPQTIAEESPPPDEILETDIPNLAGFDGRKPSRAYQFTFNVPMHNESTPVRPTQPAAPLTDPRLRLFQLQYDTYTREHLSAMVDSIAATAPTVDTHPRSTKRIKLSAPSETPSPPRRPVRSARDYIRESRSLMQQIKEARSFTTNNDSPAARTLAAAQEAEEEQQLQDDAAAFAAFQAREAEAAENGKRSAYSSLAYRKEAANLMARIKSDMHKKRLISTATEAMSSPGTPEKPTPKKRASFETEEKENDPQPTVTSSRPRPKPSPRKLLRRLSAADEVDRELALQNLSLVDAPQIIVQNAQVVVTPAVIVQHVSPTKPYLVSTPSIPGSPARIPGSPARMPGLLHPTGSARNLDDLNRFVSSSTAASSGATSTGSCVKHAGPPMMTRIAPTDLPTMPERVGAMVFDKTLNRWVKNVNSSNDTENSEDPFRDIESLHSHDSATQDLEADVDADALEDELATERYDMVGRAVESGSSFTDDEDAAPVEIMTGVADDDLDSSLDWDIAEAVTHPATETLNHFRRPSPFDSRSPMPSRAPPSFAAPGPRLLTPAAAPAPPSAPTLAAAPSPMTVPTPIALPPVQPTPVRATSTTPMVPRSVLKNTPANGSVQTPLNRPRGHRRSVSFSDGRLEGKIRGLRSDESSVSTEDHDDDTERRRSQQILPDATAPSMSLRSKKLTNVFNALEDPTWELDTPSKASTTSHNLAEPLTARARPDETRQETSRAGLQRSTSHRPSSRAGGNMTFLTECSFGVAHDRLVTVITDVQPYEPYWEDLLEIDLSNKNVESLARLREFLPKLEHLKVDANRIEWLSGAPKTLRSLSAVNNMLTSLTAFHHLVKLQRLDLSHNQLDSLHQLACLVNLRELSVEGNEVLSITGLEPLVALEKLTLRGNKIRDADFGECSWPKLESLDLSKNGLRTLRNVDVFAASLGTLNLDGNKLHSLPALALPKLRVLRVSDNAFTRLELGGMPALRTVYADGNKLREGLGDVYGLDRLRRLENLSLRNQNGVGGVKSERTLPSREIRDVKRLYLSANPLPQDFLQEACYNMVYLELAACRLEELPRDLARLVPNVRVLNLNYNFLSDIGPLVGLTRLRKLTVIGSRLKSVKAVIRVLRGMPDIEMVDFRMNPFSLGWYLPLLVRDVPGALQPSDSTSKGKRVGMGSTWEELDRKFRGDLPDGSYVGRLAYRGLVMNACSGVAEIDGVLVRSEERAKAAALLSGVAAKRAQRDA